MTLEQLSTFLTVARLGGIHSASRELHLTQPAVTARIHALEDSIGTQLFIRNQQGVTLTRAGIILRRHAEQIAYSLEQIRVQVSPAEELNFLLRIGVSETIAQSWLAEYMALIKRKYPHINIELSVDISVSLRRQLLDRKIDLAILMGPLSEYTVDNYQLPEFELSWFKPANLEKPDIKEIPIITYHRDSRPRRELEKDLMKRYGNRFQIFSSSSLSAAFDMIAKGLGVGLLPQTLGKNLVAAGQIKEFDPGWKPGPLIFTVSIIAEPINEVMTDIAKLAQITANNYQKN